VFATTCRVQLRGVVADHATVPLYFGTDPQLQIDNPTFGDDLMAIVRTLT